MANRRRKIIEIRKNLQFIGTRGEFSSIYINRFIIDIRRSIMKKIVNVCIIVLMIIFLSSVAFAKSYFVPKYLGMWAIGCIDGQATTIDKHPLQIREGNIGLSGEYLSPAVLEGQNKLVYYLGDNLLNGNMSLSSLEWQEDLKFFTLKDNISFNIAPNYQGTFLMYEIIPEVALSPGYYAFHYGQLSQGLSYNENLNIAFDFIVIDKLKANQYKEAAKVCEKFWNY
ncbi:hypothetical protein ACFL23_04400, partial [Patescibacteria group bacterium]